MSRSGVPWRARLAATAALALAIGAALLAPTAWAGAPGGTAAPAGWPAVAVDSLAQDLGVSREEAAQRLQAQERLAALAERLSSELGTRAAGTHIDQATGTLVVNVLDQAAAARVRAAGAQPRLVPHSLQQLEAAKAALDRAGGVPGAAWAVDVPTNGLVVSIPQGQADARTAAFIAKARSLGVPVRVERLAGPLAPHAFYGGQAILTGSARCTAGFITQSGSGNQYVITAGHCTDIGSTWRTSSGQTVGTTAASSFPGNDYGAIRITNPASLQPQGGILVNGAFRDITSAGRVPAGSSVCKTGSTTGTTCGTVLRYNVTVQYAQGTVSGLTETTVCTQPGDSGGPLFAGSQAQGVVSGGTVTACGSSGFRSFHQPADEILSAYGLTLR